MEQQSAARRGEARVLMQRMNACVSCARPLLWNSGARDADCADDRFKYLRNMIERYGGKGKFGYETVSRSSFNNCHLVHLSYVPPVGASELYETPITNTLTADPRLLLSPGNPLFTWSEKDIELLCPHIEPVRMARLHEQMALEAQQMWLGCVKCNSQHTCLAGLRKLLKERHNKESKMIDSTFYTLIFNCMARDNSNTIAIDTYKRETWSFRLWLNYSCILFLALMQKKIEEDEKFYMAHIHMGLADWIMTQILACILYARYDIPMGLVDLHQYYMSNIMHWARSNRACDKQKSPRCLWRWVLGEQDGRKRSELGIGGEGKPYFLTGTIAYQARLLHDKIMDFNKHWIHTIGTSLEGKSDHTMKSFFDKIKEDMTRMHNLSQRLVDGTTLENKFYTEHRLVDLETELETVLGGKGVSIPSNVTVLLYRNFIRNTFARFMYYRDAGDPRHTQIIQAFCHFLLR